MYRYKICVQYNVIVITPNLINLILALRCLVAGYVVGKLKFTGQRYMYSHIYCIIAQ